MSSSVNLSSNIIPGGLLIEDHPESKDKMEIAMIDILTKFYNHLIRYGISEPLNISNKYLNPNPVMFYKAYSDFDRLVVNYMLNEGFLSAVTKLKVPLLIKGSLTRKGHQYLMMDKLLGI